MARNEFKFIEEMKLRTANRGNEIFKINKVAYPTGNNFIRAENSIYLVNVRSQEEQTVVTG